MQRENMEMIMAKSNDNQMTLPQVLFGSVLAAATIYATWCSVSLIIFVLS